MKHNGYDEDFDCEQEHYFDFFRFTLFVVAFIALIFIAILHCKAQDLFVQQYGAQVIAQRVTPNYELMAYNLKHSAVVRIESVPVEK